MTMPSEAATVPVVQVATAVVDASGVGLARFVPVPPWKRWNLNSVHVENDGANRCAATLYRTTVQPSSALDSSAFAGNNDTTDTAILLQAGEQLVCRWTGATVGSRCTVTISGQQTDIR